MDQYLTSLDSCGATSLLLFYAEMILFKESLLRNINGASCRARLKRLGGDYSGVGKTPLSCSYYQSIFSGKLLYHVPTINPYFQESWLTWLLVVEEMYNLAWILVHCVARMLEFFVYDI